MHVFKPVWLTHGGEIKDFEVYSCHVSPDGSRLATAAGDGYVRVWSTEAIYKSADPEFSGPKQLAAISHHSGTIHAVRFSGNNKYLASGADDKIVCVYVLDPNAPLHSSTFGSNEPPPVENWRVLRRLIGHDNDVQDIEWSHDSSILVSVGLDSKVVVWSGNSFEKLKTLSHHQSLVKGITFDPANKYFATASDDRTIKVFRFTSPPPSASAQDQVNNFTLEATITVPFVGSPLTTYFRRCSWSPDGLHIAAANAVNGPVSAVAIVNRGTWDGDINLIGHEGPVEVCAFSPRMFYRDPPDKVQAKGQDKSSMPSVTVVACAGQDKTLSVWNTNYARPFLVTQELAEKAISDLAWSPDGERLFITSLDGSIMAAVFEPGELGWPASLQENEKTLSKFGAGRKAGIIENTEALLLEENSKAGEMKVVEGRMGELMGDGATGKNTVSNGVKPGSHGNSVGPVTSNGTSAPKANQGKTADDRTEKPQEAPSDPRVDKLKQRVTITKDGKKRIAPLLVSSSSAAAESSLPQTQLLSTATQAARTDTPYNILDLSKPFDGFPKGGLIGLILGNKRKLAEAEGVGERRIDKESNAGNNGPRTILINGEDGLTVPTTLPKADNLNVPHVLRPAIVNPSLAVSQVRLSVPLIRSYIIRPVDGSDPNLRGSTESPSKRPEAKDGSSIILEARNASNQQRASRQTDTEPTRVQCMHGGQQLWQDFLPKSVLLLTGNPNFWAAACEDASIYVWTPVGRRLLNAVILEAQPVILDCRGWWLLCITAVGMCHVWNLNSLSSPHPPVSLAPILDIAVQSQGPHLTPSPGIVFARLNSTGRIIVAMSNGDGFAYSPSLYVWQRLSEPWWAVGSQYWNTTDSSVGKVQTSSGPTNSVQAPDEVPTGSISAGIVPLLERNTTKQTLLRGRAYLLQRLVKSLLSAEGFEGFEACVSIAHLENRVAAALTLGAREEFRTYLLMYAKRLGAEGLKGKVEELLRSLLGPSFGQMDTSGDEQTHQETSGPGWGQGFGTAKSGICGWSREELLKEIILTLGKHRDLQRITVPYARLLGVVNGPSADVREVTDMET